MCKSHGYVIDVGDFLSVIKALTEKVFTHKETRNLPAWVAHLMSLSLCLTWSHSTAWAGHAPGDRPEQFPPHSGALLGVPVPPNARYAI